MADKSQKFKDNISGDYYVDTACVDCDLCRQTAPQNFSRNEAEGHTYVVKQPQSEKEVTDCKTALAECPVEAIGSDGIK